MRSLNYQLQHFIDTPQTCRWGIEELLRAKLQRENKIAIDKLAAVMIDAPFTDEE